MYGFVVKRKSPSVSEGIQVTPKRQTSDQYVPSLRFARPSHGLSHSPFPFILVWCRIWLRHSLSRPDAHTSRCPMFPAKHGSRRGKLSSSSQNLKPSKLPQSRYDCTKKSTLNSAGHCTGKISMDVAQTGCTAYCEVRLTMTYGQEVPFHEGTCEAGTTCMINANEAITVTNTYTINAGISLGKRGEVQEGVKVLAGRGEDTTSMLKASFDLGASYSWSESVTYGNAETQSKPLNDTTCGYWTFIPYMMGYVLPLSPLPQVPLHHKMALRLTHPQQLLRHAHRSRPKRDGCRLLHGERNSLLRGWGLVQGHGQLVQRDSVSGLERARRRHHEFCPGGLQDE
jgi:hypothetical protein